jgi:hypothetical protein
VVAVAVKLANQLAPVSVPERNRDVLGRRGNERPCQSGCHGGPSRPAAFLDAGTPPNYAASTIGKSSLERCVGQSGIRSASRPKSNASSRSAQLRCDGRQTSTPCPYSQCRCRQNDLRSVVKMPGTPNDSASRMSSTSPSSLKGPSSHLDGASISRPGNRS